MALRPGRHVDINYDGPLEGYPISVTVVGDAKVLPAAVQIVDGELVPFRQHRLVKFYADPGGFRTVRVADITVR